MSDCDPIPLWRRPSGEAQTAQRTATSSAAAPHPPTTPFQAPAAQQARFTRLELNEILGVYGRMVAAGEWRDYAIDMGRERAVFAVFRRATEFPLYRIEKCPKLAKKQGAYAVVAANGLVLKRGAELKRVLGVFDNKLRVVR